MIKKFFVNISYQVISLIIFIFLAFGAIWAYAAFIEPASAPSASNQDFAQNILGADNANNSFASTNVVANADGSIIERLQDILAKIALDSEIGGASDGASMATTLFAGQQYLWDNRASFGSQSSSKLQVYKYDGVTLVGNFLGFSGGTAACANIAYSNTDGVFTTLGSWNCQGGSFPAGYLYYSSSNCSGMVYSYGTENSNILNDGTYYAFTSWNYDLANYEWRRAPDGSCESGSWGGYGGKSYTYTSSASLPLCGGSCKIK